MFNKPAKGKVKVKSKAYEEHDRAARGSVKPAVLNSQMKEMSRKLINSTRPAKLIFDALAPFRKNFKSGLFWQVLVKHFANQIKNGESYGVSELESKNINDDYPLSRMMNLRVTLTNDMPSLTMTISLEYKMVDRFLSRCPYLNGVQLTFIALFPDFKENDISVSFAVSPIRKLDDVNVYSFIMNIPVVATSYMIVCKVEGCEEKEVTERNNNVTKSMYVVKTGLLE